MTEETTHIPVVRLRAFRAIDDPESCKMFIDGHKRVLTNIGVNKVTSSTDKWMFNPAVFVILVESLDKTKVYGGARLHVADGKILLPMETATGYMDEKVYDLVKQYAQNGTGEVCGLWNSMEVAGLGIGSIFLIRAALSISEQLGLSSMFALCSPYTTRIAGNYGFHVEKSIGNNGTFYYPKLDLVATVVVQPDAPNLPNASELETSRIFDLRKNPIQLTEEKGRKQMVTIDYNLQLSKEENNVKLA